MSRAGISCCTRIQGEYISDAISRHLNTGLTLRHQCFYLLNVGLSHRQHSVTAGADGGTGGAIHLRSFCTDPTLHSMSSGPSKPVIWKFHPPGRRGANAPFPSRFLGHRCCVNDLISSTPGRCDHRTRSRRYPRARNRFPRTISLPAPYRACGDIQISGISSHYRHMAGSTTQSHGSRPLLAWLPQFITPARSALG